MQENIYSNVRNGNVEIKHTYVAIINIDEILWENLYTLQDSQC